jgi:hypothetical protein
VRKGIANDFIIAIPFCNSKSWDLGQFGSYCTNVRLRNGQVYLPATFALERSRSRWRTLRVLVTGHSGSADFR